MELNPETGRMRKKCVPPQVRNPVTQRCKKPIIQKINVKKPVRKPVKKPVKKTDSEFDTSFFDSDTGIDNSILNGKHGLKDLLKDLPILNKKDVCIGHAMTNTYGYSLMRLRNIVDDSIRNPIQTIYNKMMDSINSNFENEKLFRYEVHNLESHSTRIYLYKRLGKVYIWYFNPWGEKYDNIYINDQSMHKIDKLSDYRINPGKIKSFSDAVSIPVADNVLLQSLGPKSFTSRTVYMISRIQKYANYKYPQLFKEMESWNKDGVKNHVMNAIYIIKLFIENNTDTSIFEVLHPRDSMTEIGVQIQTNDGEFSITDRCDMSLGACTVWNEMYDEWAIILLSKNKNTSHVIHNILPDVGYIPKDVSRYLLGRFFFYHTTQELLKENKNLVKKAMNFVISKSFVTTNSMMAIFDHFYHNLEISDDKESDYVKFITAHEKAMKKVKWEFKMFDTSILLKDFFDEVGIPQIPNPPGIISSTYFKIIINTCLILVSCKHNL